MARKAEAAPVATANANGVQEDSGNAPGSRPGPKVATHVSVPDATQILPRPAAKAPDVSTSIGQPSAKDLNERRYQARDAALREAARAAGEQINKTREEAPGFLGMRLTQDDDAGAEDGDAAGTNVPQADDKLAKTKEPDQAAKPKSSDAELAKIAEKERENRDLRRKLKAIENSPKAVDKVAKLKELAKTNPRGVAEYLGIPFEALSLAMLSGKTPEEIKLDDAPAQPEKREPTETEKELAIERAKRLELERQHSERGLRDAVATMVRDTKAKDGTLRWGNVAKVGDDPTDGRVAAIRNAQAFAAGRIGENGKPLAQPRRMKQFSDPDAKGVLEHFLDLEDRRLGALVKKIGAGAQRPVPRVVAPGIRPGPRAIPTDPSDPSHPRNRPTYVEIGEAHRARYFGPRR